MVELLRAWRAGAPDLAERLGAADSMVRNEFSYRRGNYRGYENFVLARVWEARGDRRRALSAIRLYPMGLLYTGIARRLREEGRLAAALGETDRAIEAWRRFLDDYRNPEPALIPLRDSVRAAMGRLIRP